MAERTYEGGVVHLMVSRKHSEEEIGQVPRSYFLQLGPTSQNITTNWE
jgi:hypothetical protein